MSSKMFLSAFAAVAAVAVVASPQDPSFEYPAAKHVGFDVPKEDPIQSSQSDKVSVSFKNATVREVLDWLKNQGVNFVVGDDQVNKDARININVTDQPVEGFMRALAGAWAGRWERNNDIWVFRKGGIGFSERSDLFSAEGAKNPFKIVDGSNGDHKIYEGQLGDHLKLTEAQRAELQKSLGKMDRKALEQFQKDWQGKEFQFKFDEKELQDHLKGMRKDGKFFKMDPNQKGFIIDGKDFQMFDEKQMKDMKKHFEEMEKSGAFKHFKIDPNSKGFIVDGKNFKQFDEKQMRGMEKHFQEMGKNGHFFKMDPNQSGIIVDGKSFKFDENHMKDMEKHFKEMEKSGQFKQFKLQPGQKGFMWDGKDFKPFTEQQIRDMEKRAAAAAKQGEKFRYYAVPDGKGYIIDGNKMRPANEKEAGALRERLERSAKTKGQGQLFEWNRERSFAGPKVSTSTSAHNLKAIYESLTPAQEQKLKRLGYINYSDLNSTQRSLLGVVTDDSWTISYKTGRAALTIKSDR
jgi:hypothetical protein